MNIFPAYPINRPRRLRRSHVMRELVKENRLSLNNIVYPIFIRHGLDDVRPIISMPGQMQWTLDHLGKEIKNIYDLGIRAVMPFGIPAHKDPNGSDNLNPNGIAASAIKIIKDTCPDMMVISDICLCDYADHGHCTIIDPSNGHYLNEPTLKYLSQAAVIHAKAGADMVAPSGMIDGMVFAIREALNNAGFIYTPIMSYAVKYASAFYGPFREAAECLPQFGDRKTYQMDPANSREAIKEASIDITEGADIIMVKPALPYLDIVRTLHEEFKTPIAAYHTSGEYSSLVAAAQNGWLDLEKTAMESLVSIKRAGADIILTYFAKDVSKWL